jgi:hypothetical protein
MSGEFPRHHRSYPESDGRYRNIKREKEKLHAANLRAGLRNDGYGLATAAVEFLTRVESLHAEGATVRPLDGDGSEITHEVPIPDDLQVRIGNTVVVEAKFWVNEYWSSCGIYGDYSDNYWTWVILSVVHERYNIGLEEDYDL